MSDLGSDIDNDEYFLGLDVPAGRRCYVVARRLILTENSYVIEVLRPANGFTGGILGFHSPLREGGTDNVNSRVYGGVTPDGAETVLSRDIVEAGNDPGSSRTPVVPTDDVNLRSYTSPVVMRIQRLTGGGTYRLALRLIAFEEEED